MFVGLLTFLIGLINQNQLHTGIVNINVDNKIVVQNSMRELSHLNLMIL